MATWYKDGYLWETDGDARPEEGWQRVGVEPGEDEDVYTLDGREQGARALIKAAQRDRSRNINNILQSYGLNPRATTGEMKGLAQKVTQAVIRGAGEDEIRSIATTPVDATRRGGGDRQYITPTSDTYGGPPGSPGRVAPPPVVTPEPEMHIHGEPGAGLPPAPTVMSTADKVAAWQPGAAGLDNAALLQKYTPAQLATLPREVLRTFSNEDLLKIASATPSASEFLLGFDQERQDLFPAEVMNPLRGPLPSGTVEADVPAPTVVGGVTYVPRTAPPPVTSINQQRGDWVGSPGDTGPTGNPNAPVNPNVGAPAVAPNGVVQEQVRNPTLPGGPQGIAPAVAFKGGDAANGPAPAPTVTPAPVSRPVVAAAPRQAGFGIPRVSAAYDPMAQFIGLATAGGRVVAPSSGSSVTAAPRQASSRARLSSVGAPTVIPAGNPELPGEDDGPKFNPATGEFEGGPMNPPISDPFTGGVDMEPGSGVSGPGPTAGGGPVRTDRPDSPGRGYQWVTEWDNMANEGRGGWVEKPRLDPDYIDPVEAARLARGGGRASQPTIINTGVGQDYFRAGTNLRDAQTQALIDKAEADTAGANADLARARATLEQAKANRIPADIAAAEAEVAEKSRQFDITIQNQQAARAQQNAQFLAGQEADARQRAQQQGQFDTTTSGYDAGGAPTLSRETAGAEQERANLVALANRATQAAEIALKRGDQVEAQRQNDIKADLDNRRFGLESEMQRGRLGLETELGRGRLDIDRGGLDLQRQKQVWEMARDPFSATVKAQQLRGGAAPPPVVMPEPGREMDSTGRYTLMGAPQGGGGYIERGGFTGQGAPKVTAAASSPYEGMTPGLRTVLEGGKLGGVKSPLPFLSAQAKSRLAPSERTIYRAELLSRGANPEDVEEEERKLSATAPAPRVTMATAGRRY